MERIKYAAGIRAGSDDKHEEYNDGNYDIPDEDMIDDDFGSEFESDDKDNAKEGESDSEDDA